MTEPKPTSSSAPQAGGDETPVAWTRRSELEKLRSMLPGYARAIWAARTDFIEGGEPADVPLFTRPTPAAAADEAQCMQHGECFGGKCIHTAAGVPTERFIMDHGMWHDILTGQHLYTEDQHSAALKDLADEAWSALEAAGVPRDGVRSLGESISKLAASPVAPAGVPTDEQIKALWDAHSFAGLSGQTCHNWLEFARAVLSAGAPAVPLQDSSSVHLAADDSSRALRAASKETPLPDVARELTRMFGGAIARVDTDGDVLGYVVQTGALHRIVGLMQNAGHNVIVPRGMPEEIIPPPIQCDGRDGVTDSAASSEAREATPASHGSNETEGAA